MKATAQQGLEQIKEKGYANRYKGRALFLVGIGIDEEKRNLGCYTMERVSSQNAGKWFRTEGAKEKRGGSHGGHRGYGERKRRVRTENTEGTEKEKRRVRTENTEGTEKDENVEDMAD